VGLLPSSLLIPLLYLAGDQRKPAFVLVCLAELDQPDGQNKQNEPDQPVPSV
jgi:hypothetical protein